MRPAGAGAAPGKPGARSGSEPRPPQPSSGVCPVLRLLILVPQTRRRTEHPRNAQRVCHGGFGAFAADDFDF